ncbi:MAG: S9 family peptidase, partial [Acidimicrobiia bacterium]|nr:S9 family peptidase [Acidimicrobiia bacterium]
MTTIAPFGSWESPIGAADTVAGIVRFSDIQYDDGALYWLESRPSEQGRTVLLRRSSDGTEKEPLSDTANVRTMVHEYGGAAYLAHDGEITYSEFTDQRLYRMSGDTATPLTPEPPRPMSVRFGDAACDNEGSIICVRESHPAEGEATNELVRIDAHGAATVIASGSDFYSSPRISPDGKQLAWIEWSHPNMPWDGTRLVVADAVDPADRTVVAGGLDESIVQPEWTPDGSLLFVSDRTGWWNLYRSEGGTTTPIIEMEAEFAGPAWVFGMSWYGVLSGGRIVAAFWENGEQHLGVVDREGHLDRLDLGYSNYGGVTTDGDRTVWFVGAHPRRPSALVEFDIDSRTTSIVRANPANVDDAYVPEARPITFPTTGGDAAHAVFYPPTSPVFEAPRDEYPPLLVHIHGGPTSNVYPLFSLQTAYWTSRGFGVVDVNY